MQENVLFDYDELDVRDSLPDFDTSNILNTFVLKGDIRHKVHPMFWMLLSLIRTYQVLYILLPLVDTKHHEDVLPS